jgi:hypothetical protein
MKSPSAGHLLLHVAPRNSHPVEGAVLSYLWLEEPARRGTPNEEPPPGILRGLSAGRLAASSAQHKPELPVAPRPRVTSRTGRTPSRPWV